MPIDSFETDGNDQLKRVKRQVSSKRLDKPCFHYKS